MSLILVHHGFMRRVKDTDYNLTLVASNTILCLGEKEMSMAWGATDVNHETTNWCRCEEKAEAHSEGYQ